MQDLGYTQAWANHRTNIDAADGSDPTGDNGTALSGAKEVWLCVSGGTVWSVELWVRVNSVWARVDGQEWFDQAKPLLTATTLNTVADRFFVKVTEMTGANVNVDYVTR